jgi:hypothetical protein
MIEFSYQWPLRLNHQQKIKEIVETLKPGVVAVEVDEGVAVGIAALNPHC